MLFGKRSWLEQAEPADKNPLLTWSEDCLLFDKAGLGASSIEAAGNKAADEHSDKSLDPAEPANSLTPASERGCGGQIKGSLDQKERI